MAPIRNPILVRREQATLQDENRHDSLVVTISTAWLREHLLGIPMSQPVGLGAADQWVKG